MRLQLPLKSAYAHPKLPGDLLFARSVSAKSGHQDRAHLRRQAVIPTVVDAASCGHIDRDPPQDAPRERLGAAPGGCSPFRPFVLRLAEAIGRALVISRQNAVASVRLVTKSSIPSLYAGQTGDPWPDEDRDRPRSISHGLAL